MALHRKPFPKLPQLLLLGSIGFSLDSSAFAQDSIQWNGFMTLGMSMLDRVTEVPYRSELTHEPNYQFDTKLGLNIRAKINDEWTVNAQLLASAGNDPTPLRADWFFMSYEPIKNLTFRFGRQKTSLWMTSEYIDIGKAYFWIRPPEEVYGMFPLRVYDGVGATYGVSFGKYDLKLEANYGNVSLDISGSTLEAPKIFSTNLEFGREILKARFAYKRARWSLPVVLWDARDIEVTNFGLSSRVGNLTILAEYSDVVDKEKSKYEGLAAEAFAQGDFQRYGLLSANFDKLDGYYVTTAYRLIDVLVPHITYAQSNAAKNGMQAYHGGQTSITYGLVYEFAPTADIKLEYKDISRDDDQTGLFTPSRASGQTVADVETANVISLAFNVIF